MKFSPIALALTTLLSALWASHTAWAEQTCNPSYTIKYSTCVTQDSPAVIKSMTTDWILVNQGASRITDQICIEHIGVIAHEHPKATNIKFVELDDRPVPWRGWGKRDVYCKFSMDEPALQPLESPSCGIQGVERQGCAERLSFEFLQSCLNGPTYSDEDLWKKAACLVDSYTDAPHISHLDSKTYDELIFQLKMLKSRFLMSPSKNERGLSNYVQQHFNE